MAVIAVVLGLALLAGAVANDYTERQNIKTKQHQAALVAAEKKGYERGTSDRTQYLTRDALWELECTKGRAAYDKLTTAQKRLIPANQVPVCNQPILQAP